MSRQVGAGAAGPPQKRSKRIAARATAVRGTKRKLNVMQTQQTERESNTLTYDTDTNSITNQTNTGRPDSNASHSDKEDFRSQFKGLLNEAMPEITKSIVQAIRQDMPMVSNILNHRNKDDSSPPASSSRDEGEDVIPGITLESGQQVIPGITLEAGQHQSQSSETFSPSNNVMNNINQSGSTPPGKSNNSNVYAVNSISRPLALGVEDKVKAKIWADMYVNFECLLVKQEARDVKYTFQAGNGEGEDGPGFVKVQQASSKISTVTQWLEAFHIYVSIYCQKYPTESPKLMKYASIIMNVASKSTDEAALKYDKSFRQMRHNNPLNMPFDTLVAELYNTALAEGLESKFKAAQQLFLANGSGRSKGNFGNKRKLTCHTYNNTGSCTKVLCKFGHFCQHCSGAHSRKNCQKWLSRVTSSTQSGDKNNKQVSSQKPLPNKK